ncbi:hypothetical protein [Porcipelethomonas sp.]|uniref:hypothetical protein n=1 Tax=Porcipelethomonas sp. TaxID=2981675 RepID=UPI003EF375A8
MLKGLLENKSCRECRICCGFDKTDIWEMPVMNSDTAKELSRLRPDTEFTEKDGAFIVKAGRLEGDELFFCPALDKEKGCILGDKKPFDCSIWPYRIMDLNGTWVISICPVCGELYNRPLRELVEFVENGLGEKIYKYALENPDIVKKYDHSYPILKVLGEENTDNCLKRTIN